MRDKPLISPWFQNGSLLVLVLLVTLLFAGVIWPLSGAVVWAVFMAVVFSSLQERSVHVCRGRHGWAAFGTLVVIVVSVLLPMALLTASVVQEASAFYARIRSGEIDIGAYVRHGVDALPAWAQSALARFGLDELPAIQSKLVDALGRSGDAITAQAFTIGQSTLDFFLNLFVMLYLLFFLLRDGKLLAARATKALPLEPEHTARLITEFAKVVRATVKGNVVVALVQGALGWLAFSVLGITGALLWGTVMAVLSLLPAVGAAMVWGPVAIYLISKGSIVEGVGLMAWGTLVIGLVDNVLRPVLVGKETRLPDYVVLVTTIGGLALFGLSGFVLGPVVAAMFLVAWDIFTEVRQEQRLAAELAAEPAAAVPPHQVIEPTVTAQSAPTRAETASAPEPQPDQETM